MGEPKYMTIKEKLKANEMMEKWGQKLPYPDAERFRQFMDAYKEKEPTGDNRG